MNLGTVTARCIAVLRWHRGREGANSTPNKQIVGWRKIMTVGTSGREHGGLGGSYGSTHEAVPEKKPDVSPCVSVRVRPRTRFRDDRETPSRNEDTMLLLVFRTLNQKKKTKLGRGFTLF